MTNQKAAVMRMMVHKISDDCSHPVYDELGQMRSSFSRRLIPLQRKTQRFRRSYVRAVITGYHRNCTILIITGTNINLIHPIPQGLGLKLFMEKRCIWTNYAYCYMYFTKKHVHRVPLFVILHCIMKIIPLLLF